MVYTIEQIKQIVRPIAAAYGVESIRLFGSYARGEATDNSDVDLLIDRGDVRSGFRNLHEITNTSCLSESAPVPCGPEGLRLRCRRSTCPGTPPSSALQERIHPKQSAQLISLQFLILGGLYSDLRSGLRKELDMVTLQGADAELLSRIHKDEVTIYER